MRAFIPLAAATKSGSTESILAKTDALQPPLSKDLSNQADEVRGVPTEPTRICRSGGNAKLLSPSRALTACKFKTQVLDSQLQ
jgi:hypothetical protein